jgi:hypothetical protein
MQSTETDGMSLSLMNRLLGATNISTLNVAEGIEIPKRNLNCRVTREMLDISAFGFVTIG